MNPSASPYGSPDEALRCWVGGLLAGAHRDTRAPCNDPAALAAFLQHHGIRPCLEDVLTQQGLALTGVAAPPGQDHQCIAGEMVRAHEFSKTLRRAESVLPERPLVFKGQALAYSLYRQPWLRPRADIDVLIEKQHWGGLLGVFRSAGYREQTRIDGDLILRQITMRKRLPGSEHLWDVHWALSNRPAFAGILEPGRLRRHAVAVSTDEVEFLAPAPVDNLLIACIHLIGHHSHDIRMIWLYDIHLLIGSLTETQRAVFVQEALRRRESRSACHAALTLTHHYLPAEPTDLARRALDPGPRQRLNPTRRYFTRLLEDVKSTDRSSRFQLVKQHLFPSPDYMIRRFDIEQRWQLPLWYAVRIGRALPKLLRRH